MFYSDHQQQSVVMTMQQKQAEDSDYLRLKQAAHFINVSPTTLWRLSERDPSFPPKIKAGERLCFYRRSDLAKWLESREV